MIPFLLASLVVRAGEADVLVGGSTVPTGALVRRVIQGMGVDEGERVTSSFFNGYGAWGVYVCGLCGDT